MTMSDYRKAMFTDGAVKWCMFITEDEIPKMETLYNCKFVKWMN